MLRLVVYSCVTFRIHQAATVYLLTSVACKKEKKWYDLPVMLKLNQELHFAANKQIKSVDT